MGSPGGEPGLAGPRARALPPLPTLPDSGERHRGQRVPSARPRQKRDPVRHAASAPHVLAPPCGMSTARLSSQLSSSPSTLPVRQAFLTSAHSSEPLLLSAVASSLSFRNSVLSAGSSRLKDSSVLPDCHWLPAAVLSLTFHRQAAFHRQPALSETGLNLPCSTLQFPKHF